MGKSRGAVSPRWLLLSSEPQSLRESLGSCHHLTEKEAAGRQAVWRKQTQSVGGNEGGRRRNISTMFHSIFCFTKFTTQSLQYFHHMNPDYTLRWLFRMPEPTLCKVAFYLNLEVDEEPKSCLYSGSPEGGPRIARRLLIIFRKWDKMGSNAAGHVQRELRLTDRNRF